MRIAVLTTFCGNIIRIFFKLTDFCLKFYTARVNDDTDSCNFLKSLPSMNYGGI